MTTPYEAFLFGEIRSALNAMSGSESDPKHLKHVAAILDLGWDMFEPQYLIDITQTLPHEFRCTIPVRNRKIAHLMYYPPEYHPYILGVGSSREVYMDKLYRNSNEAWLDLKDSDSCGNSSIRGPLHSAFLAIWYHDSILDRMPTEKDYEVFRWNFVPERNPMLPNSSQKYWRRVIREAGYKSIPQTFLDPEIARLRSLLDH